MRAHSAVDWRAARQLAAAALVVACGGGGTGPGDNGNNGGGTPVLLGRWGHGMAWDDARRVVLLFGGRGPATAGAAETDQRSLWSFDGTAWRQLSDGASGPSARNSAAVAFDAARSRLVVFGGRQGADPTGPAFGDTWEWNGAAWTQALATQAGLVAREHVAGAYDPVRQKVAIVGGFNPTTGSDLHDQWEWTGSAWTSLSSAVPNLGFAPVLANAGAALTLLQSRTSDRAIQVLVASGAGQWTPVVPSGAVPALTGYAAARLPAGGILLFGGSDGTTVRADTWKWDGSAWSKLGVTGPSARLSAAMALDVARARVVLYGGQTAAGTALADTWEFDGTAWRQVP
jgi:hypothetical protein